MATEERDLLATDSPDVINPRDGSIDSTTGKVNNGSPPNTNKEGRSPDVTIQRDDSIESVASKVDSGIESEVDSGLDSGSASNINKEERDLLDTRSPDVTDPRDGSIDSVAGTVGNGDLSNTNKEERDLPEARPAHVANPGAGSLDSVAGTVDSGSPPNTNKAVHKSAARSLLLSLAYWLPWILFPILRPVVKVIQAVKWAFYWIIECGSWCPLLDVLDWQCTLPYIADTRWCKKFRPIGWFFRCYEKGSSRKLPVLRAVKKRKLQPALAAVVAAADAADLKLVAELSTAFEWEKLGFLVMIEEENEPNVNKAERREKKRKDKKVLMDIGSNSASAGVPLPTDNALADRTGN